MNNNEIIRYEAGFDKGLTSEQVNERKIQGLNNAAVDSTMKTNGAIVRENIFTYFNLIFAVIAVLVILVGSFKSLTFLPVIICNIGIGIFQELRSKKVLEKMNMLNAPHSIVVRDGAECVVNSEELVLDDIVIFAAGNQICADAIVIEGEVKVNESLLTGESDEITKKAGDTLMSGSIVVSGKCYARLDKVGADSYISKLIVQAKAMNNKEQSEMIRSLNQLVKWVGIIIIPVGLGLFAQSYWFNHLSMKTSVVSTVAALIGMIPEGLYLLATVALAVSAMRLAKSKVLLHDMKSIETLARVDVMCVDKTGTITENTMIVHDVEPLAEDEDVFLLLGDFAGAMEADNITMKALKEFFVSNSGKKPDKIIPFSSVFKYSGASFDGRALVLGAPEYVLRDSYDSCREKIEDFTSKGLRTLVFADYSGELDGKTLMGEAKPLALVTLTNPIRANAIPTFKYFNEQGVAIKVISGDNPLTVSRVATEACIKGAENYVDATTLTEEDDIREALQKYTVFGRVAPEQKRTFVRILKELGHTVAMTGDGVNDVLALKDADCSVAMASGSEAAAQSAQVVLLDSDFSRMPLVVLEGRRTVNNIERSASLFLVKNTFSFLLAIISLIFISTYPLQPTQVTLIGTFTIGVPGFFLALEPNHDIIRGKFIRNVLLRALPAGLTDVIVALAVVNIGKHLGISGEQVSTVATLCLAFVGFLIVYRISRPLNKFRLSVILMNVSGVVFCYCFLNKLFILERLTRESMIMLLIAAACASVLFIGLCCLVKILPKIFHRKRDKGVA